MDTEARNHPGHLPAILLLSFANLYTVLHDGCWKNSFMNGVFYYKCNCQILFSFPNYNAYPWYSHDNHRDL